MRGIAAILTAMLLLMMPAEEPEPADRWEDPQESQKIEEALDWHTVKGCTLTAYCPCRSCCGKDDGITYTGVPAQEGHTVAVDPAVIPLGAWVEINGELYHAEDTGGAIAGKRIDVFFEDHGRANDYGRKTGVTVRWYE